VEAKYTVSPVMRRIRKFLGAWPCVFVLCLASPIPLWAIDPDRRLDQLYHTTWTAKDGAPTSITSCTQTPDGFLWFGGFSGLVRFDGIKFEDYEALAGVKLPKLGINAILGLSDASLLVAWTTGGVSMLKNGRLLEVSGPGSGLEGISIYRFGQGGDGSVLGMAVGRGVFRMNDGGRWTRVGVDWPLPSYSSLFYVDRQGTVWFGTETAIFYLRRGEEKSHKLPVGGRSITQSPDGVLWLKSSTSIRPISPDGVEPELVKAAPGQDLGEHILADSKGSIWSAGNGKGIARVPFPQRKSAMRQVLDETFSAKDGLTGDIVAGMFEDREGDVWVITTKGLDSFRQSNVVPVNVPDSGGYAFLDSSEKSVRVVAYSSRAIVMTVTDGLVANVHPWPFRTIYIYPGRNGVTWLGTQDNGVVKMTNGQGQHIDTPGRLVGVLTEDDKGRLWAGGGAAAGLVRLEDGKWTSLRSLGGPPQGYFSCITDSIGRVWFGFKENRVAMMRGDKLTTYTPTDGVDVGIVMEIREAENTVVIGGERGLEVFDGHRFFPILPNNGGPFEKVWGLLYSKQSGLWFAENRGLAHIPLEEMRLVQADPNHRVSFEVFGFYDGLPSNLQHTAYRPASIESPDGRVWFALETGLVWIDPRRIVRNRVAPGVAVDSVVAGGTTYHLLSPLTLPARTRSLRVSFAASTAVNPQRVRFRYKLEGVDKDWQDAGGRRETSYTNLGPGSYRFQVTASNGDGVWNESGAIASFSIIPAFYETFWFKGLCVLAGGMLLAGAYQLRVRQIAAAMNARFNVRLAERARIARELHDTLLQSVQGLMLRLQVVDDLLPDGEAKEQLDQSLDRMEQAVNEGRQAVHGLRSPALAGGDLTQAIQDAANELASDSTTFRLLVEGSVRELQPLLSDDIYRIAHEGLRNAFHHGQARKVETEITFDDRVFRLRIRDDGVGIPADILTGGREGHYGLTGMRERARQAGAKLVIWSKPEAGTEIEVSVLGSVAYVSSQSRAFARRFRKNEDDL
jgi:signal transduction histidine kinase